MLQNHPAAWLLPSRTGCSPLRVDLLRLEASLYSGKLDLRRIGSLVNAVRTNASDTEIWDQVYHAVTERSTPPRQASSSVLQTAWRLTTSSVVDSSEKREKVDQLHHEELGAMYVDVPEFHEAFFGRIPELETASKSIFQKCTQGKQPLFRQGWKGWPEDAKEDSVLSWLADVFEHILQWAQDYRPTMRRLFVQHDVLLKGPVAKRRPYVGFVNVSEADEAEKYAWSRILVPGVLQSSSNDDTAFKARLDLGRYMTKVFTTQPTRRFVLGFTLCGSWMRLWEFDRLGGIASERFDIDKDGQCFVSTIISFLWMNTEDLGFDPTIIQSENQLYLEVRQGTKTERLVLDRLIRPAHCIAGRATICWKAYLEGDKSQQFVIKDSWQFPDRGEEGKLLEEATAQGVTNVARHYYHETVRIQGEEDDIQGNVRRGLDITRASNYQSGHARNVQASTAEAASVNSCTDSKRASIHTSALIPPRKRPCLGSASPTMSDSEPLPNRFHRRIILRDY